MAKSFTKDPLYDEESARAVGQVPKVGEHWSSRLASGPKEGLILKHQDHPTFNMAVKDERKMGYRMSSGPDGRIWSQPKEKPLAPGHTALTYVGEPIKTEKLP